MRTKKVDTFLLIVVVLCGLPAAGTPAQATTEAYRAAVIREQPFPGIRFSSNLTVCDEELRNGRWLSRYWMSSGQIKPEFHLESERQAMNGLPVDAFQLVIEGQDLAGSWSWIKAEKTETPAGLLVTFELASRVRPVQVKVHTLLTGGPMMIRWLEITNTGAKPTAITKVSPWSGLLWHTRGYGERLQEGRDEVFDVGHTQNETWGQEGAWRFDPVVNETKVISGSHGKSGWGHPTFFAHNNASGEWFVGSLAWSANWTMRITGQQDTVNKDAHLFFEMGPSTVDPVLRVIEPNETVKTPEAHLLCMKSDLDHVTQALEDHVRHNVLPPRPSNHVFDVEANHRGYIVDHESEAGIDREIDLAADIGAEMFVIDAGWYGPEPNNWANNVGDWYAGAWLPNDLMPVREYARKKGLRFGLWVEIESVGAAAKLRREHPDWVLTRNGQPVAGGRQLDVSNPAVAAWMESEIARIIRKYDLDMFRIDYNNSMEAGGNHVRDGFIENTLWRHVENLYGMFDRLRKEFPNVIFQNCSSGGGRLDWGIMRRFDNTELSDWMRAPRSMKIINGMTWVLPPEILLRTPGTETDDLEADGDLDTQLRQAEVALPIFRGISPTLEDFNPILRGKIREGVALYKNTLRPNMIGCHVYHHTPVLPLLQASPWVVIEYAAPDQGRDVATLFRTAEVGDATFHFIPRGLNAGRAYRVTFGNSGQTAEISGERLMQEGIVVRLEAAETSEMLMFDGK